MTKDLITLQELSTKDINGLLRSAASLKKQKSKITSALKGKSIALIFQKPSNRTRVSFEVGIYQLGGTCIYLGPGEINLGKRETAADVARTLSRYVDAIVARTFSHDDVIELAKYASIPIINGLSDLAHPCQALADIQTIQENFPKSKKVTLAYIGDGNNVLHSLLIGCAKVGIHVNVATPLGYTPDPRIVNVAKSYATETGVTIMLTQSPQDAVKGAHAIYTDVWTSMGQEEETAKRLKDFQGFQINAELCQLAAKDHIFMHCLPAHRGEEVTDEVIEGKHSVVFEQAENRLHAQKAVLLFLMGQKVMKK